MHYPNQQPTPLAMSLANGLSRSYNQRKLSVCYMGKSIGIFKINSITSHVGYVTLSCRLGTPSPYSSIMMSALHHEHMLSEFQQQRAFLSNHGDPLGRAHMGMLLWKWRVYSFMD